MSHSTTLLKKSGIDIFKHFQNIVPFYNFTKKSGIGHYITFSKHCPILQHELHRDAPHFQTIPRHHLSGWNPPCSQQCLRMERLNHGGYSVNMWLIYGYYMVNDGYVYIYIFLLGGLNQTLWKMMELKWVGMMTFAKEWKVIIQSCSKPPIISVG